jgi:hypothetical protein
MEVKSCCAYTGETPRRRITFFAFHQNKSFHTARVTSGPNRLDPYVSFHQQRTLARENRGAAACGVARSPTRLQPTAMRLSHAELLIAALAAHGLRQR